MVDSVDSTVKMFGFHSNNTRFSGQTKGKVTGVCEVKLCPNSQ